MLSKLIPFYILGGAIAAGMFVAAIAAEGRAAHILRVWLKAGSRKPVQALRDEALTGDVEREPNDLHLVRQLGAAERRYREIDARRERHHTNA